MKKNITKKMMATSIATALCFGCCLNTGMALMKAKADNLNSVNVVIDEPFENLDIFTRTEGSYSADMVYTMIYDRLFTLDQNGNFGLGLLEDAEFIDRGESGGVTSLNYINLTYALGWEVQPNFETNLVLLDEGEGGGFLLCQLKEGINFQNGAALTVDSLIALVDYAKLQPTNTLIYPFARGC